MAAIPECCRTGFKWEGTPIGHEGRLAQNDSYITGSGKELGILIVTDIFGWTLPNIRLIADHFAKELNATVHVPDFFGGEVLPEEDIDKTLANPACKLIDIHGFFVKNSKEIRQPEIFACAKALRQSHSKVAAIGYCFGGWACFRLAAKGQNLVDAISTAHPSLLEKAEIDAVGVPTQIIAPEFDHVLTAELKEYCNKTIPTLGIPYQYDFYPGLNHGFAVKGDIKDPKQKLGLERANNAIVSWFKENFY